MSALNGRLWIVDVESGAARRLTSGDEQIWEFCWAPDGSAIAAITSDMPHRWDWYQARSSRVDIASGDVTTLHQPERQIGASGLVARRQMDRRDDQYLE